jgi:hypothetical protein
MYRIAALLAFASLSTSCAAQQPNSKLDSVASKHTSSVAFSTESGRPVVVAQVNGQEMPVIFDSGSQGAIIAKSLADSMKLEVIGEALVGSPYGGPPKTAFIVSLVSLALGGVNAVQTDAIIIDDSQMPPGSPALVIGPNLFSDRVVELDFANKTLRFSSEIPGDVGSWQKMDGRGMLKTLLMIGQENVEVTIDTGNPGGLNLPKSLADRLGIALTPMPGRKIRTVDAEFPLYEGMVDQDVMLAGAPLRLGKTMFAEIPSANAGAKTLDGLRLIIDTPRRRWRLESAAG